MLPTATGVEGRRTPNSCP